MTEATLAISLPSGDTVTAIRTEPEGERTPWTVVYAPGAGSNVHDPFGRYLCRRLASEGSECVRFQFPYMEARKRRPDAPALLEATWRTVIEAVRRQGARLCVGGRSMGGRIATQAVAQGEAVDALALFAYPLHPPGKPEQRRDAHLPSITAPAFFCSGTRDAFASPDELREVVPAMPNAALHLLDGADHGFAVPKASGRSPEDVWAEAMEAFSEWLEGVAR